MLRLCAAALLAALPLCAQQSRPAPLKKPGAETQRAAVAVAGAQEAIARKDYTAAATLLENFLLEHPGHAEALFNLAYVYGLEGRTPEAIDTYRQTLEVDPKLVAARVNLGLLLLHSDKPEAAVTEFRQAAELEPDNYQIQLYLAAALHRLGQKEEALEHYRRAAALDPAQAEPRRALLDLLLEKNDWAGADRVLEELQALEPKEATWLRRRGDLRLRQRKPAEALAAYEEYLKAKPADAEIHLVVGRLYRAQDRLEEALPHFLAAEQAAPSATDPIARVSLRERADTLAALRRSSEAIPLYRRALELDSGDAQLHADLGYVLLESRDYPQAVKELTQAVQLAPEQIETHNYLASALYLSGDLAGAIEVLDRRAAHAPETPGTLFLRAISYDKLKQCGPAITYYEKFLALNPDTKSDSYFQATGRLRLLKNVCRETRR